MLIKDDDKKINNILTRNGFVKESKSVDGRLDDVYEKCIKLLDEECSYYAYVAVNISTNDVHIYVEYDCGGEVASYDATLHESNFEENEEEFINELDRLATDYLL
ncbi:hypothetical protein [Lachnospira multipara]|uniref:Uncharacterized protein n=1 Tax=Lachnospira multipara TaxID=28051 RepID=A0A1H5VS29_9FIRM|nr:hypothetical protein [Lachnospira multipara]SEF89778.1 hypothetical protein SAMN05216537_11246 [Lachnospira multipara]